MPDVRLKEPIGDLKTRYQAIFWVVGSGVVLEHAGRLLLHRNILVDGVLGVFKCLLAVLSAQV